MTTMQQSIAHYREKRDAERQLNSDVMQAMIARAKALRGEPDDEDEDEAEMADIFTQLTCRDGRNGGAYND
jgi:hypothetical protein